MGKALVGIAGVAEAEVVDPGDAQSSHLQVRCRAYTYGNVLRTRARSLDKSYAAYTVVLPIVQGGGRSHPKGFEQSGNR